MTTTTPLGPRYPPISPPWDGDPQAVLDAAAVELGLSATDYGRARLGLCVDTVTELVRSFLDCAVPFDDAAQTTPIPPALFMACVTASIEGYRRKDATFGLAGSFNADGIPVKITQDWLAPVVLILAPYKQRWGLA